MKTSKQAADVKIIDEKARARRMQWSWTEASIWTDPMLTALDNGVKGGKWFSLIDKIYRKQVLENAWQKVKANKGASGVDKMTIEKFEQNKEQYLEELGNALKDDTYRPQPVRRVYIPKGQGKMRPLGIPTVKDRIVQQAVKMALEPIFEKEFLDMSYGFRPNKSAQTAIKAVEELIKEGYVWYIDADITAYFDSIPHEKLLEKIEQRISDGRILNVIRMWLKQEIMEECKTWIPDAGSPQGAVISPLLSNIYLHELDVLMTQKGFKMIRYADDFVILAKSQEEAKQGLEIVRQWMKEHGLELHPDKTHVGNCMEKGDGFDFLGYRFETGTTWVRKKSSQKFRDRIKELTSKVCGKPIVEIIKKINPVLKGWCNYFKRVTKYTLGSFDGFVRRRLRAVVEYQKHKRKCFGAFSSNKRIPNKFFADFGLFNMEESQRSSLAR